MTSSGATTRGGKIERGSDTQRPVAPRVPGEHDDDARFRALFDGHLADVWRFARRRCASDADADDVAAEAFAVVWRRRADLPEGDAARMWLFGIARLVLSNARRSRGRREALDGRLRSMPPPGPEPVDPADLVADREDARLLDALATLEERDREVLLLRAWDGLAVTEMAALLGTTPNAVSVRLSRARRRLATALGRTGGLRSGHVTGDPESRGGAP